MVTIVVVVRNERRTLRSEQMRDASGPLNNLIKRWSDAVAFAAQRGTLGGSVSILRSFLARLLTSTTRLIAASRADLTNWGVSPVPLSNTLILDIIMANMVDIFLLLSLLMLIGS